MVCCAFLRAGGTRGSIDLSSRLMLAWQRPPLLYSFEAVFHDWLVAVYAVSITHGCQQTVMVVVAVVVALTADVAGWLCMTGWPYSWLSGRIAACVSASNWTAV